MYLTELHPVLHKQETMKVKMFVHNSPEAAEKEINDWLAVQQVNISHITQSQCERQGRFVLVVSVFYAGE